MKSGQDPNVIDDESSAADRSAATHVKEEDMEEYSDTIESDREARRMNIEVLHYEIKGRFLQPNREMSDTKAKLSGNLHPTSIDRREEDESNKEMVNNDQRKLEGSEAGPLEEAHSIMSDIIKKVVNRNSDTGKKDVTDRTDSEPLDDLRLANNVLKNDASTDCLEVNKKENPTDDEARFPRTAYSDNWATNENPDE